LLLPAPQLQSHKKQRFVPLVVGEFVKDDSIWRSREAASSGLQDALDHQAQIQSQLEHCQDALSVSGYLDWQLLPTLHEQQQQQRRQSEQHAAFLAGFQSKVRCILAHQFASRRPPCKAALHATCHTKHYQTLLMTLFPHALLWLSQRFYISSWSRQKHLRCSTSAACTVRSPACSL
jgi:hypothetical protein